MSVSDLQLLTDLPIIEDWQSLLISGIPLLDVRAPVEHMAGALPNSHNLPLLNDNERQQIGTCYKQKGQDSAIKLGLRLISGSIKQERVNAWQIFAENNPEGALFCFRGGLRSRISQQWLYEQTGLAYPRLKGGYKAIRRFLLEQLDDLPVLYKPWVLSGRTGSGKTRLLRLMPQTVDLEHLANHRGSAFGAWITPQPSQVSFENDLAIALITQVYSGHKALLFEDESANVGSVHFPKHFLKTLRQSPLIMLNVPLDQRIEISYQEYVCDMSEAFLAEAGNEALGLMAFQGYLLGSLRKIRRRLGGARFAVVQELMQQALHEQRCSGRLESHQAWIAFLLHDYYDPMYDYQLQQKHQRVVFAGDESEVAEFWQYTLGSH